MDRAIATSAAPLYGWRENPADFHCPGRKTMDPMAMAAKTRQLPLPNQTEKRVRP
jgi:hypothetical protein